MRTPRAVLFWIAAIFCLALAARVYRLDQKNVWLDEAVSWSHARMSTADMIAATRADIHPPGYYFALSGWVKLFGDTAAGLRSFSALFSVAAIVLTFAIGRRLLPITATLAVLAWLAVSPHAIHYAQEARMYTLGVAAVLGACVAYLGWLRSHRQRRSLLVLYVLCATTAVYAHYFTALPLAALVLHQLLPWRSEDRAPGDVRAQPWLSRDWVIANMAIVLLYLPWIGVAIEHFTRGQPWRAPVESAGIITHLGKMTTEFLIGYYGSAADAQLPAIVLWLGVGALAVRVARRWDVEDGLLLSLAIVPIGLASLLLLSSGHMQLSRYLAYSSPLLVLASARGFLRSGLAPRYVAAVFVLAAAWTIPSLRAYYSDPVKDSDYRPIVAHIRSAERAGTVFLSPSYMTAPFDFVMRSATPSEGIPRGVEIASFLTERPEAGWLVLDYRSPDFGATLSHPRLHEIPVPLPTGRLVRLFAVAGAAASPHH